MISPRKGKEIKLLSQYVRKLEEEARVRDTQRERLLTDAQIARSKFKQTESEQQQLVSRRREVEFDEFDESSPVEKRTY